MFLYFSVREGWNKESLQEGCKLSVKRRVYACYDDMKYEGFFKKNLLAYKNEGFQRKEEREKRSKNSGQPSVAQFSGVQDGTSLSGMRLARQASIRSHSRT